MEFYKYSGSGNDFILLDHRLEHPQLSPGKIKEWCDRRYGIGADGVISIGMSPQQDFAMRIFNSDGTEAEMCGNGARCSIHYYHHVLSTTQKTQYSFSTMNGQYEGEILGNNQVRIKMTELYDIDKLDVTDLGRKNALYLNTGVPHTVIEVSRVEDVNVQSVGPAIRYDERFVEGTNVCFFHLVQDQKQTIRLRVYERGVEAETLCCGTGVMATAVAAARFFAWSGEISVKAEGGDLMAIVDRELEDLYFQGEVLQVFKGNLF